MISRHYNFILLALAACGLIVLVYWPGLSGRFLFDDYPNIVSNVPVHAESLNLESIGTAAKAYEHGYYGRPLATISFALNYIVGGTDPFGFKATNLAIHLLNSVLVFILLRRMLALPRAGQDWTSTAALAIALLWAIHPLQISTVLYVVQRMETLSLTFVLAALIAYLLGRNAQIHGQRGWPWLVLCAPLVLLGLLSKESAILFPAYTVGIELTLLRFSARSITTKRLWILAYSVSALVACIVFAGYFLPHYLDPSLFEFRGFTLGERLLTQLRVLPMYLGQMLLPLPQSLTFYYDTYPISHGLLDPVTTVLGGALLAALAYTAIAIRRYLPLVSLGIIWFFAAHILTSNVFPLENVFEHRNYFALLGVLIALADLVRRIPLRDGPMLKRVAIVSIIFGFGTLATLRSATWGDSLNLAMAHVSSNQNSARASNDLAEQYMAMAEGSSSSPFYTMAIHEFERGSRLPGSSPLPEQGLILLAASAGQPGDDAWWDSLIGKLRTRPLGPQEQGAVAGLLKHRYEGIDIDDRRLAEAYITLADRTTLPGHVYAQFGDHAITYLHDDALADRMFAAAVENSNDPTYAARLIAALIADDHQQQARAVALRARTLGDAKP